ncbi:MAG: OsmC family protein, partial [Alphaproteobacteria bacterium]
MTTTENIIDQHEIINGVDVTALSETLDAVGANPELAQFQFRNSNTWIDGSHNRSTIKGFYGAGAEDTTRTEAFEFDADEPPVLLGEDVGANPVEYLLHALAGCMTTTMVYHAAASGIVIEALSSNIEGDIDIRGFTGVAADVPKEFREIRVNFRAKTDGDADELKALAEMSPVFNTISGAV